MASKKAPTPKPAHIELLLSYINKHGGVQLTSECARLYSQDVVDYCIQSKKVTTIVIAATCKHNLMPVQRLNAIFTNEWKRDRPVWLDDYLAQLRKRLGIVVPQDGTAL